MAFVVAIFMACEDARGVAETPGRRPSARNRGPRRSDLFGGRRRSALAPGRGPETFGRWVLPERLGGGGAGLERVQRRRGARRRE